MYNGHITGPAQGEESTIEFVEINEEQVQGNGSGSATGRVVLDGAGRATEIKWSNGVVFTRK